MTAVFTAGMTLTMLMVVMIAFCIGIIIEFTANIGNNSLISTSLYTTEEFNTCFSQSILCSATDTATDKHLNT